MGGPEGPHAPGGRRPARLRSSDEPEPIATVLRRLAGDRPWAAGLALGALAASWSDVVGDRLAAECEPARLENGSLLIRATSGAWGAQVNFLGEAIRARANEVLGTDAVRDVRVVIGND